MKKVKLIIPEIEKVTFMKNLKKVVQKVEPKAKNKRKP